MTAATRIYKHSAAGTDWAALIVGAGLGLIGAQPPRLHELVEALDA